MSFTIAHEDPVKDNTDLLRGEFGWKEVASGLGRILLGYAVLIGGLLFCATLIVASVLHAAKHPSTPKNPNLLSLWLLYLGFGLTGLICPISYVLILMGKIRCALNAPERHAARWMMFACLVCILMGPALNVAAGATGMKERPNFQRGPAGVMRIQFNKRGVGMQLAGSTVSLASLLFFMLFLRAIGRCFLDQGRILHVNAYLFFLAILVCACIYAAIGGAGLLRKPALLLALLGGLALAFFWHLYLIGTFRTCISRGLEQIRSPLEEN